MSNSTNNFIAYADGACSGNPGPGGYAFEIHEVYANGEMSLVSEGRDMSIQTTNNIMELTAALMALSAIDANATLGANTAIKFRLDSKYVLDGMFQYLSGWKANSWRTSSKKPVKNLDLWQGVDALMESITGKGITLAPEWIKGHAGEPGNERVDTAAQAERDRAIAQASGTQSKTPMAEPAPITVAVSAPVEPVQEVRPITPEQVGDMREILELYGSGDYSVKDVINAIRINKRKLL